jgi:hypothetical protein
LSLLTTLLVVWAIASMPIALAVAAVLEGASRSVQPAVSVRHPSRAIRLPA